MNKFNIITPLILGAPLCAAGTISTLPSYTLAHQLIHMTKINSSQEETQHPQLANANSNPGYKMSYAKYLQQVSKYKNQDNLHHIYNSLGSGYDESTGKDTGYTAFDLFDTTKKTVIIRANSTEASLKAVSSSSQLINELGVNAKLRFGFRNMGAAASVDFFNKVETDTNSINLVFESKSSVDMQFNYNIDFDRVFKNTAAKAEDGNDWTHFQKMYSDSFIRHETGTRKVLLNLSVSLTKSQDTNNFKTSLKGHYDLASVETQIKKHYNENKRDLDIKIQYMTFPTKIINILPTGISLDASHLTQYMSALAVNCDTFMSNYHRTNGQADNARDWIPQGIDPHDDLMKYSDLDYKISFTNHYLDLMKKYPELDKYFDQAISLNEDSNYIENSNKILPPDNNIDDLLPSINVEIQNYNMQFNILFANNSPALIELVNNHNEVPLLLKTSQVSQDINQSGAGLKIVDYIMHTSFHFTASDDSQMAYIFNLSQIDNNSYRLCLQANIDSPNWTIITNLVFTKKQFEFTSGSETLWTPDNLYVQQNGNFDTYNIPQNNFKKNIIGYNIETVIPQNGVGRFSAETILNVGIIHDNLYN